MIWATVSSWSCFCWLYLPLANYLVSLSTHDLPWGPPLGHTHSSQPRWISKWRLLGGARLIHHGLALSPDFWPTGGLSVHMSESPLSQTGESGDPSVLHADRILPPLSLPWLLPWLLPGLSESTWDKDWSLALFLLLLLFWRANRRLIVNSSTGAHLSLVSGNVNSSKYPAWSPLLPAPWNADRRPTVKVWPGAHLSPAKSVSY